MVYVVKHSGEKQEFDRSKVEFALLRAGAGKKLASELAKKVESQITDATSTGKVYKLAFDLLKDHDSPTATRFGLKVAIMRLGPSGYPFEKYVSRILSEHGYSTVINQIMGGRCVDHEIDVVAEKDGKTYLVECKYHNQRGVTSGLKEALYTWARFEDLVAAGHRFDGCGIFTNTRCTSEARKYAKCKDLRVTSWDYPQGESLRDLIESNRLYPITILRGMDDKAKARLADKSIILAQDLLSMGVNELSEVTGVKVGKIQGLREEVGQVMGRS